MVPSYPFSGIRWRAIALGTIPLLFMLAAFASIYYLQTQTQSAEAWAQHSDDVLAQVQRLDKSAEVVSNAATAYVFAADRGARARFEASVPALVAQGRKITSMVRDNPTQSHDALAMEQQLGRAIVLLRRYVQLADRGDRAGINALIVHGIKEPNKNALSLAQQRFQNEEVRLQHLRRDRSRSLWVELDLLLALLAVLGIAFTVLLNADFGTRVVGRLERLARNADAFGPGGVPPSPLGGNDEIARLDEAYRRTATQLNAALREALQASELKSQFVATMSHEIRTPMNGVIGTTDLLLRTNLDAQQTEYAHTVRDSGEALLTVINEILDFSKIEAGKMELDPREVELVSLVEGAAAVLMPQAHAKRLSLMTFVDPNLPSYVVADAGRLRQILLNLGSNAVKFTTSGDVVISVIAKSRGDSAAVLEFSVKDTGIGMPSEVVAKLFRPFQQADGSTSRRYGGTGLGLTISQRLVELMGGRIDVASSPRNGSTFTFTLELPVVAKRTEAAQQPTSRAAHVLIVDDDPISCNILSEYIASWSMTYDIVNDPREAVARLERAQELRKPFDVAVIDFSMPHVDGFTLAREIRKNPRVAALRLVMVTAYDSEGKAEQAAAAGFGAYLVKPVRQSRLYNSLVEATVIEPIALRGDNKTQLADAKTSALRILVAEDNAVNRRLALQQLGIFGYSADTVENGREAVARASSGEYDLILMDCQMPEVDGFEATRAIRKIEARTGKYTRIIALTANALSSDRQACIDAGMDGYLSKPVLLDRLQTVLQDAHLTGDVALKARMQENGQQKHVLDFKRLRDIFGDDPKAVAQFLVMALPSLVELVSRLSDCTASLQCLPVAHELKGASGNLGAQQLSDAAASLERRLQDGGDASELKQRVKEALAAVARAIDEYVEGVPS